MLFYVLFFMVYVKHKIENQFAIINVSGKENFSATISKRLKFFNFEKIEKQITLISYF